MRASQRVTGQCQYILPRGCPSPPFRFADSVRRLSNFIRPNIERTRAQPAINRSNFWFASGFLFHCRQFDGFVSSSYVSGSFFYIFRMQRPLAYLSSSHLSRSIAGLRLCASRWPSLATMLHMPQIIFIDSIKSVHSKYIDNPHTYTYTYSCHARRDTISGMCRYALTIYNK